LTNGFSKKKQKLKKTSPETDETLTTRKIVYTKEDRRWRPKRQGGGVVEKGGRPNKRSRPPEEFKAVSRGRTCKGLEGENCSNRSWEENTSKIRGD